MGSYRSCFPAGGLPLAHPFQSSSHERHRGPSVHDADHLLSVSGPGVSAPSRLLPVGDEPGARFLFRQQVASTSAPDRPVAPIPGHLQARLPPPSVAQHSAFSDRGSPHLRPLGTVLFSPWLGGLFDKADERPIHFQQHGPSPRDLWHHGGAGRATDADGAGFAGVQLLQRCQWFLRLHAGAGLGLLHRSALRAGDRIQHLSLEGREIRSPPLLVWPDPAGKLVIHRSPSSPPHHCFDPSALRLCCHRRRAVPGGADQSSKLAQGYLLGLAPGPVPGHCGLREY